MARLSYCFIVEMASSISSGLKPCLEGSPLKLTSKNIG